MATVNQLRVGTPVEVTSGEFAGKRGSVVDPVPFPDNDLRRRRKIIVDVAGERVYLLPRILTVVPSQESEESVSDPDFVSLDDDRFDPYRPHNLPKYVSRKLPNGMTDVEFLLTYHERRQNVVLVGDTQGGKTLLVQILAVEAAKAMGLRKPLPVYTLSGSIGISDYDLFGQTTSYTDERGHDRLVWLPGLVDLATRHGGILYLDEVNMMAERVTSSLHPLCDDRRQFINRAKVVKHGDSFFPEVVAAHENLWIIGTMNPSTYRGAGALNEAFANRFAWLPWDYDAAVEKALVPSETVRLIGQALRKAREERILSTPVGTSALQRLYADLERYGVDVALWSFKAMFQKQEIPKVDVIFNDRSFVALLQAEFTEV